MQQVYIGTNECGAPVPYALDTPEEIDTATAAMQAAGVAAVRIYCDDHGTSWILRQDGDIRRVSAMIYDLGQGFPAVGDTVVDSDSEAWEIVAITGPIDTSSRRGNAIPVTLEWLGGADDDTEYFMASVDFEG